MIRSLALVLLVVAGACAAPPAAPDPLAASTLWLAQDLAWGRQCDPGAGEGRDDLLDALHEAGLAVVAMARRGRAACRACHTCPAFAETVWLLVPPESQDLARAMGYVMEQEPDPTDVVWP